MIRLKSCVCDSARKEAVVVEATMCHAFPELRQEQKGFLKATGNDSERFKGEVKMFGCQIEFENMQAGQGEKRSRYGRRGRSFRSYVQPLLYKHLCRKGFRISYCSTIQLLAENILAASSKPADGGIK